MWLQASGTSTGRPRSRRIVRAAIFPENIAAEASAISCASPAE